MSSRTRRAKNTNNKLPSASHYVGYVEDEEDVESIMKKFEVMEKLKEELQNKKEMSKVNSENEKEDKEENKDVANTSDNGFDENYLENVFLMTSAYDVQTTLEREEEERLMYGEDSYEDIVNSLDSESEDKSFNEDSFFNEEDSSEKRRKKKLEKAMKPPKEKKSAKRNGSRSKSKGDDTEGGSGGSNISNVKKRLTCEVTDENGYKYTIRKKIKKKDPLKEESIRIPKDTASWARDILPYEAKLDAPPKGCKYMEIENITTVDWSSEENNQDKYLAILMDPPWKCESKEGLGVTVEDIKKMTLPQTAQFIFIWTEKEVIPGVVNLMEEWGYYYVENMVWVKKQVNNTFVGQDYDYFRKSKVTLLIFRKNGKEPVELRHQRSPDVYFDFVRMKEVYSESQKTNRFSSYGHESKPLFTYHLIETLLLTGNYEEKRGHGQFLHLWCDHEYYRKGWTMVNS